MNKWLILLVVFTGFICFSSGKPTKPKYKPPKNTINIRFDRGTRHFMAKHYSGPPTEAGTKDGEKATQIVGSVSKTQFVGGETQAKAARDKGQTVTLKITAKVQEWSWSHGSWKKVGGEELKADIRLKGTWEADGDFVNMTWDTGF